MEYRPRKKTYLQVLDEREPACPHCPHPASDHHLDAEEGCDCGRCEVRGCPCNERVREAR